MTAKISKWGNSAAIRIPNDIMKFLSLHIGDSVALHKTENSIEITLIDDKESRLIAEAKRIKEHAKSEYHLLEGTLEDGLSDV